MTPAIQVEIDGNFDQFQRKVGGLLSTREGEFALMRERRIVGFYGTAVEAERAGVRDYSDGIFSIQEVTERPADLGFFASASNQG